MVVTPPDRWLHIQRQTSKWIAAGFCSAEPVHAPALDLPQGSGVLWL